MSPEQARGEIARVDTRSDVYSLGVLFYEIVAERLPYVVTDLPLPEAVIRIAESPPAGLKARGTLTGRIDSDLETIVSKCLEKEPDRRYGSAAELAEDLDRLIEHRPILARPPTTVYQVRKLLGRTNLRSDSAWHVPAEFLEATSAPVIRGTPWLSWTDRFQGSSISMPQERKPRGGC